MKTLDLEASLKRSSCKYIKISSASTGRSNVSFAFLMKFQAVYLICIEISAVFKFAQALGAPN